MENQPTSPTQPNPKPTSIKQPSPDPQPPTPSKTKKWLIPLVIIITIISLGISCFFTYQYFQLKKQLSSPVVTPKPYPLETRPPPTAN